MCFSPFEDFSSHRCVVASKHDFSFWENGGGVMEHDLVIPREFADGANIGGLTSHHSLRHLPVGDENMTADCMGADQRL